MICGSFNYSASEILNIQGRDEQFFYGIILKGNMFSQEKDWQIEEGFTCEWLNEQFMQNNE